MSEPSQLRAIQRLALSSLILIHATGSDGGATTFLLPRVAVYCTQDTATTEGKENTKQLQFKILLAGEMVDENKVHLGITNYLASDGVGVTVIHGEFPSATAAQEYFERALTKALKITERGEKKTRQTKLSVKEQQRSSPPVSPTSHSLRFS
jgi:hypothetical protein